MLPSPRRNLLWKRSQDFPWSTWNPLPEPNPLCLLKSDKKALNKKVFNIECSNEALRNELEDALKDTKDAYMTIYNLEKELDTKCSQIEFSHKANQKLQLRNRELENKVSGLREALQIETCNQKKTERSVWCNKNRSE